MYKKIFIPIFSIFLLLLNVSFVLPETIDKKAAPLLNENILKGFYLHSSEKSIYKWDELKSMDYHKSRGMDIDKVKSEKIIFYEEYWCTLPKKDMKKYVSKKTNERPDYKIFSLYRTNLKSHEAALEWVKSEMKEHPWVEGSFSGKKVGDGCWSNKFQEDKPRFSPQLMFVKDNVVVRMGMVRIHGKGDPLFVEKVAEFVVSKL